ncbi:MAG TPA: acetoacetate--CoA ligase [Steroidobacteraceae bacterium]|jgi:acetoacetyl-CoA synthetase|nr:acetoacetate--CoA ligase [Steroidobacteraceae bacterium]
MKKIVEGELLWTPSAGRRARSHLTRYLRWLEQRGQKFDDYEALWRWSVSDLPAFWQSMVDFCGMQFTVAPETVLGRREMPGAEWFPGAKLNYAAHALRHERPGEDALVYLSERRPLAAMKWTEFARQVRVLATWMRALGIAPGDRVVAYLPNTPEALVAMYATASIGAVWSSCGPDFGARGVLDRYSQLSPRLIFCVDGYSYGGKLFDKRAEISQIIEGLPSLAHVVHLPYLDPDDLTPLTPRSQFWADALAGTDPGREAFQFEQVPFAHPLFILFSSGTTGLPKAIVHCHGGITLEQLKLFHFHMDLHARQRMFFFTSTGWMMWNFLASSLLMDAVPVLYDGNPAWPTPDLLWKMADDTGANLFGASPTYQAILEKAGIVPKHNFRLEKLETIVLAGSPVTAECQAWFYENVKADCWAHSGSGGTDVCSGLVGGVVNLPIHAGEIQARQLGVAAYAFDDQGKAVVDQVGELVLTEPLPSMPVGFWGDIDGSRYRESYFDQWPGVWRHGDFFRINARGGCFVLGRSDATLNRHGVRIGTAEVYRSLLGVGEVEDSLIVNLDLPGGKFFMPLFVKLKGDQALDPGIESKIRTQIRNEYSPRHVPDRIFQVRAIPYTLTGKKMEVPVRRILMGVPVEKAANRAAMANVEALDFFIDYARTQSDYRLTT